MEDNKKENGFNFKSCLTLIGMGIVFLIAMSFINGVLDMIGRFLSQIPWFVWLIIGGLVLWAIQKK